MPTTTTPRTEAPADTTMMRIVHDAVRRDLERARLVLAPDAPTTPAQRRALGAHLGWVIEFLHAHHASEDRGLYPLVRRRTDGDPMATALLDRMAADHEAVAASLEELGAHAGALAATGDPAAAERTHATLEAVAEVLLPHLRVEEDEAMPLASGVVSHAEWAALEREHNLDPKSTAQLGFEGHWLIDGASDADRATVLGLVPPLPRFLLLHGFRRRYRRHAAACWGPGRPTRRVQLTNRVEVAVDAPVDAVWSVVSDPTRVGEWSGECVEARWLGGATAAVPGARFRGRNRAGLFRWGRICEVLAAEPHELVWRTVPTRAYPDSSRWRIRLEPDGSGTRITESFEVVAAPKLLAVVYGALIPAHRDRTAALAEDLRRLGAVAAAATAS